MHQLVGFHQSSVINVSCCHRSFRIKPAFYRFLITLTVLLTAATACLAQAPVTQPAGQTGEAVLQVPPFPDNLDLSSVEKLYHSAAYRVEVRQAGTVDYTRCFVFETRNDWVLLDFFGKFGKDKTRVRHGADEFGDEKGQMRTASFAQFSFANTAVDVRVTLLAAGTVAKSVTIRPLRHQLPATISADGKVITFTLPRPLKVSIEINDRLNPLFLFDDTPDTPDVSANHYFGPGVHRLPDDGRMTLVTGDHVYLAAGAIVEGRFLLAPGSSNISIRGRGILSMGEWPHITASPSWLVKNATFYSKGTDHLTIEGLTLVQGSAWTVAIDDSTGQRTHDNLYQNIKMVHWAGNTDAFWITGHHNRVEDCFVFNNDDAIVSKGGSDCRVNNLVFWGGAWGRLTLLFNFGHPISNIMIENVDVIGKGETPHFIIAERLGRSPAIDVKDITFRNVRFEERAAPTTRNAEYFVDLNADKARIRLTGLRFENVSLDQQFDDEGAISGTPEQPWKDITFANLRMGGRLILSAAQSHIRFNDSVTNVTFAPTPVKE